MEEAKKNAVVCRWSMTTPSHPNPDFFSLVLASLRRPSIPRSPRTALASRFPLPRPWPVIPSGSHLFPSSWFPRLSLFFFFA
jgi:hypothetical protein